MEWIGWIASLLLCATIVAQIAKQCRERSSQGVSPWLFAGQLISGVGFVIYSWQVKNWVFVVTNSFLFVTNVLGLFITFYFKSRESKISPREE